MSQEARRIAGRYEVSLLDGGGMGLIWKGYDTVLDRQVAIKQIRTDGNAARRKELADRFRREARVTAKIEHPGVPAVYDAAIDRDIDDIEQLYLVMQFVRGVTVADLLAEQGPLPVAWAVAITAQICAVLSHAHAIPIVHRDLKPSNVMVDVDGNIKVLDFGIAAVLNTDVTKLTAPGDGVGSRDYMSPEQFYGTPVSPRSDLYALGCLLHEMLTGRKVFEGTSDPALQHIQDAPTPVRELRSDIDPAIEQLVLDLLAKAAEDRPASAQEVFDRLVPFLPRTGQPRPQPSADGTPDPTRPYREPLAPRRLATPQPVPVPSSPVHAAVAHLTPSLIEELNSAEQKASALIDEERFTQAANILRDVLSSTDARAVAEHPRILELRSTRAAALFLGGSYRQALVAFEGLADSHALLAGHRDRQVMDYRKQAAYCHVELGDTEAALAGFRALLHDIQRDGRSHTAEALELQLQVGILLLAAHRLRDAATILGPLERDLLAQRGPNDSTVQEVRDLLTRIRLTDGS